ncbi:MAG: hypothetical protein NT157_01860 [Candidatus Micrarchaeota archaeon]|nr:hypothetical protein [Candidatus Micrarchaeota archaeon]
MDPFLLLCAVDLLGRDSAVTISFIIILLIVAVSQMFARAFSRHDWQAWANDQTYQAILSVVLVANIAFFAFVACQWSGWVTGGEPFNLATNYLDRLIKSGEKTTYDLFMFKYRLEFYSSFRIKMGPNPNTAINLSPWMGVAANIENISWFFPVGIANLMIQRIILEVAQQIAFAIVLPMGVILRIFPFTRNAGAFLIAAAFGMYVIFPVTYVFSSWAMDHLEPDRGWWLNVPLNQPASLLKLIGLAAGGWGIGRIFLFDFSFFLQISFLPALSMLVTVTFIKSLTKFLVKGFGE